MPFGEKIALNGPTPAEAETTAREAFVVQCSDYLEDVRSSILERAQQRGYDAQKPTYINEIIVITTEVDGQTRSDVAIPARLGPAHNLPNKFVWVFSDGTVFPVFKNSQEKGELREYHIKALSLADPNDHSTRILLHPAIKPDAQLNTGVVPGSYTERPGLHAGSIQRSFTTTGNFIKLSLATYYPHKGSKDCLAAPEGPETLGKFAALVEQTMAERAANSQP